MAVFAGWGLDLDESRQQRHLLGCGNYDLDRCQRGDGTKRIPLPLPGDQHRGNRRTSSAAALTVLDAQALVQLLFQAVLQRPADAGGSPVLKRFWLRGARHPRCWVTYLFRQSMAPGNLSRRSGSTTPPWRECRIILACRTGPTRCMRERSRSRARRPVCRQRRVRSEVWQPGQHRLVQQLYLNVLGRPADPDGLTYWVGQLNNGASRGTVLVGFSESRRVQGRHGQPGGDRAPLLPAAASDAECGRAVRVGSVSSMATVRPTPYSRRPILTASLTLIMCRRFSRDSCAAPPTQER